MFNWLKKSKIELFFFYSKIELFFTWLEELNFFQYDSKNWTLFEIWFKELFLNLDSKNWTFYYLTQRVELFIGEFQFFESYSKKVQCWKKVIFKKKSILWVVLKKNQFCESYSYFKKKKNILRVTMKKGINSSSHFWVKNILKRRFKSVSRKKSNSLSFFFFGEKNQVFESCYKEGFNSSSHIGKNRVILKKQLHLFESYWKEVHNKRFNSLSHMKKIQIFESFWEKKKKSILWVIFFWKWFDFFEFFKKSLLYF